MLVSSYKLDTPHLREHASIPWTLEARRTNHDSELLSFNLRFNGNVYVKIHLKSWNKKERKDNDIQKAKLERDYSTHARRL